VNVFVVADAHGNGALVRALLEQEGLPRPGVLVIQIGDLANCVLGSEADDLDALSLIGDGIDLMLLGNHEAPALGADGFWGYFPHSSVRERMRRLVDQGVVALSHLADSVLITHAGLSSYWGRPDEYAANAHGHLEFLWRKGKGVWRHDPTVMACGRLRGGSYAQGGILWSDWSEPKRSVFPQLVGHTVGEEIRRRRNATCIDLGAGKGRPRIAGAWIRDGQIETVIYAHDKSRKPPRRGYLKKAAR
jgi:calcineurin-like phosphoesterase family protein